jgi:hypothetical protein
MLLKSMQRIGRSYLPIAMKEPEYRRIMQFEQAGLAYFESDGSGLIKLTPAGHEELSKDSALDASERGAA